MGEKGERRVGGEEGEGDLPCDGFIVAWMQTRLVCWDDGDVDGNGKRERRGEVAKTEEGTGGGFDGWMFRATADALFLPLYKRSE